VTIPNNHRRRNSSLAESHLALDTYKNAGVLLAAFLDENFFIIFSKKRKFDEEKLWAE
jgi:hypothetical protein